MENLQKRLAKKTLFFLDDSESIARTGEVLEAGEVGANP
jgi:polysaccharide deacetylase 2 family uncharacterized protein YibQ